MSLLNPHKSATRDFFLYLLMGGTFYFLIFDFVWLIFSYINEMLPDALSGYEYFADGIRAQLASMIVLFPVYLGIAWFIRKDLNANTEKVEFGLRKFFIYLTLFIAAVALIVDLITLINYFLDGEITLRFVLKVLVALVTALGVGGYFWYEIKRGPDSPPSKKLAIGASLLVIGTVVWGLVLAGSPSTRRINRLDEMRVNNINEISSNPINAFWNSNSRLPASLDELSKLDNYKLPIDPDTKTPYEYRVIDTKKYELCATFGLPTDTKSAIKGATPYREPYGAGISWDHPAGRHCYTFEMKDQYPNDSDKSLYSVPVVK